MFRFLIAFCAVCVFSIASVGVAQAGGANNGGNDNGAGGGKGGGKKGSIEITNDGEEDITVFYRAEQDGSPADLGELRENPSVVVEPGDTETISGLKEGAFELAAVNTDLIEDESDNQQIPSKNGGDPGFLVVDVMNDSVTEVTVDDSESSFGDAEFTSATVTEND